MVSRSEPLIIHLVHSLEGGGTERVLVSLLRAFDHSTVRHAVVTLRAAGSLAAQLPDEVACIALETQGRSLSTGLRLAGISRQLRPSIIHARNVCTWADALAARLLFPEFKLVLGFHGLESGGQFSRRHRMMARLGRSLGAAFASVSLLGQRQMAQELGIPEAEIHHIPNGIDMSQFDLKTDAQREAIRRSLGYGPHERIVGVVGSLTTVKGHDVLLSAFANAAQVNPHIRLLIVGEGPLRKDLEAAAKDRAIHDRVKYLGFCDDVPTILSALDAYVCASHGEGMSNALMEAMAAGLPIVSTAVGDHPTLLQDGQNGLVVRAGDAVALADAIQALLSSPNRAAALGRSARARIQEFSFTKTVAAYDRLYAELMPPPLPCTLEIASVCRRVSKSVTSVVLPRVHANLQVK